MHNRPEPRVLAAQPNRNNRTTRPIRGTPSYQGRSWNSHRGVNHLYVPAALDLETALISLIYCFVLTGAQFSFQLKWIHAYLILVVRYVELENLAVRVHSGSTGWQDYGVTAEVSNFKQSIKNRFTGAARVSQGCSDLLMVVDEINTALVLLAVMAELVILTVT